MQTRHSSNLTDSDSATGAQDERRAYPRHLSRLRVQLLRSDTLPLVVKTVELSRGGMHVETDRPTMQLLVPPDSSEVDDSAERPFTARITMPHAGRTPAMTMQAEVADVVALAEDCFRVGLRFTRFYGASRDRLVQFIDSLPQHG